MRTLSADEFEPSKVVAELFDGSGAVRLPGLFTADQVAAAREIIVRETADSALTGSHFNKDDEDATLHLDAMNRLGPAPWRLSFSYGRALQAAPLKAWSGKADNLSAAQAAFFERAKANGAATRGAYA